MNDVLRVIQVLVAPVVMISAGGLLGLAWYNRLAGIVSRARSFHKERFEAQARLDAMSPEEQAGPTAGHLRHRRDLLVNQVERILGRARLIRGALICLLSMVLCMLACSLALGLSLVLPGVFEPLALGLFCLGVLFVMLGVILAMAELARALGPVAVEDAATAGQMRE